MNVNLKRCVGQVASSLGAVLVCALLGSLSGCAGADPGSSTEEVGSTQGELVKDSVGAAYAADCIKAGVPAPPNWGKGNIGVSGGWKKLGHYDDTYTADFNGTAYSAVMSTGVCVLNAHDASGVNGAFDVICQGSNGTACFWEGSQPPAEPPGKVTLIGGNWSTAPASATPVSGGGPGTAFCTNCHAGQNVFLTHYKTGHPLNLTGTANWMPSWYDPVVPYGASQNPGPETFAGYPESTSGCTGCHSSTGIGGRFPRLSAAEFGETYCGILKQVTNRPGSKAGMPPDLPNKPNNCTPDKNCAAQTDPFVIAMLNTCAGVATSRANSPATIEAFGDFTPFNGQWKHVVASKGSGSSVKNMEADNIAVSGSFQGWSSTDITSALNSSFRSSVWLKGELFDAQGSNFTIAATDAVGTIWEKGSPGGRQNVTRNSPVAAVGSPSAYIRHDGVTTVVFRGDDDYIYESSWDGASTWSTNKFPGQTVLAQGDPIGYKTDNSSRVVYKCGPKVICEERLIHSSWVFRQIQTAAVIRPFVPTPLNDLYWGEKTIFYTGADGVHTLVDTCDPLFCAPKDKLIYPEVNVVSAPIPYNNDNSGTNLVFIVDGGGSRASYVVEMTKENSSAAWTSTVVLSVSKSSETLVGDPAAIQNIGTDVNTIFIRNSDNKLYELRWDFATSKYIKKTVSL